MQDVNGFKAAFLNDLLQRAKAFISFWIGEGASTEVYARFFRHKAEAKAWLDPASLLFFSRLVLEKDMAEGESRLTTIKSFFDITLGYALLFTDSSEYHLTQELLGHAIYLLNLLDENLEALAEQETILKDLFSSKLLQALGMSMDVSQSLTKRRKLILEFMTRIAKMQERLHADFGKDIPLAFELHSSLKKCLNIFRVVEEGRKFSSFIGKIKLKAMLKSEIDSQKIAHLTKQYRTEAQKFTTGFKREITATDEDMFIRIDKNTSSDLVKVTHEDGRMLFIDSANVKSGKNLKMALTKGQKATLEFPSYPQILQYGGYIRTRHNVYEQCDNWKKLEKSTEAAPV